MLFAYTFDLIVENPFKFQTLEKLISNMKILNLHFIGISTVYNPCFINFSNTQNTWSCVRLVTFIYKPCIYHGLYSINMSNCYLIHINTLYYCLLCEKKIKFSCSTWYIDNELHSLKTLEKRRNKICLENWFSAPIIV